MNDLIINCEICDIRRINPENYEQYNKIVVNTELALSNNHSKAALSELNILFNSEEFVECDGDIDIEISTINGNYSISGDTHTKSSTLLTVNGNVYIAPNSKNALQNFIKIVVNGSVLCAEGLAPFLSHVSVNGPISFYPDDYTVLSSNFTIDKYFPLTARESGKYFIQNVALIKDKSVDFSLLAKKQVKFNAKKLILPEETIDEVIPLFDNATEFTVIPMGFSFANSNAKLDESLIKQHGRKIFVNGNLDAKNDISQIISEIDEIIVNGKVTVTQKTKDDFDSINAKYNKYEISKSVVLRDKHAVNMNNHLLKLSCDGVSIINCAHLIIAEDVTPQDIINLAELRNIAQVSCTEEQAAAIMLIGENISKTVTDTSSDMHTEETDSNPPADVSKTLNARIINAENFIM